MILILFTFYISGCEYYYRVGHDMTLEKYILYSHIEAKKSIPRYAIRITIFSAGSKSWVGDLYQLSKN
jgi:hypothetical protein